MHLETRTMDLGPLTLKVEIDHDDYDVSDWLCSHSDTPTGISYDRKENVLIDADVQVYFEDLQQQLVDAFEAEREPRLIAAHAVRDAAWAKLSIGERYMFDNDTWWYNHLTDAMRDYRDAFAAVQKIWDEPEPELPDSVYAKYNDEGYLILPWPDGESHPQADYRQYHNSRYYTLEYHKLGLDAWERREQKYQAADPAYPVYTREQETGWAAMDAALAITFYNDEWSYLDITCKITLDSEDDEPGEGQLLGEDMSGGYVSNSDESIESGIKDCLHEALRLAFEEFPAVLVGEDMAEYRAYPLGRWKIMLDNRLKAADWDVTR